MKNNSKPVKQDSLPFPPKPSGSTAGRTMQESTYSPKVAIRALPDDAPNILIVLIDDAGPGLPTTFGGEVKTKTMDRIVGEGIAYNRFHTTAMCSPTRASMLTGRNHHRVGAGQIAELANDWDGYSGHIPRSSALAAEVLKNYGYSTAAFGKWHNTPAEETTPAGPFENWPTNQGFEYFYGFLAGEASQYEPNLVRNTTSVLPPKSAHEGYHLSEDLADDAIHWLRNHKAFQADKPFYMYWASGAIHGPHQVQKEWADKYKGKFDAGWDEYRERVFITAKEKGWIPQEAQLTPRHPTMAAWDSIPEDEKPFQRRLMEVAAGFTEHVDVQVGRVVDELDRLGYADNTLIFYVWGDNGSSAEGQNGTISELLAQNGIPSTIKQHIDALEELGGLDALGSSKTDNQYHAGWAWAGSTPYQGTKLLASHFGGTRNPMAVRWPAKIKPDGVPRAQFHHCNDIVPTIYEVIGITPPSQVNGVAQDPIDGVSFAYSFADHDAKGRLLTQYFEIMGSRSIYHEGWIASAIGPRLPWVPGLPPGIREWTPDKDIWELYNLNEDWSQAHDLAASMPDKLAQMKDLFLIEVTKNKGLPIGGGLWIAAIHPEMRLAPPYTEWNFSGNTVRMPEFCAPALGNRSNIVTIEADIPAAANGVLYKLGANSGGLTCFVEDGILCYEYNLFIIQRTKIRATQQLPVGKVKIEIETACVVARPGGPLKVTMKVNGEVVAEGTVPISAPLLFTANDCLDIGIALGSPVSLDYHDKAPFKFNGHIENVHVKYVTADYFFDIENRKNSMNAKSALTPEQIENIVRRSYQYVAMYNVIQKFALDPTSGALFMNGFNKPVSMTRLVDHTIKTIARPNNDTLYQGAILDLRRDAVIIEFPAIDTKFAALEMSGYDHNVTVPLATSQGDFRQPVKILFYTDRTEGYQGKPVRGVDRIVKVDCDFTIAFLRAMPHQIDPTRMARIIQSLRDTKVVTLSEFLGEPVKESGEEKCPAFGKTDGDVFADNLLEVMQFIFNHTTFDLNNAMDQAVLAAYQPLGVAPGKVFNSNETVGIDGAQFRDVASDVAQRVLASQADSALIARITPMMFMPKGHFDLETQVMQSVVGPIGLPAYQARYVPVATTNGKPMNAMHNYVLRMSKDELPPATAFWSLTLYDLKDGFFIPNEGKKYSVGENAGYNLNADGGIEIYVSALQPEGVPAENWLPINREDIDINGMFRIYAPDTDKIKTWVTPKFDLLQPEN